MDFFDVVKSVAKGVSKVGGAVLDKATEIKERAEKIQNEVMVYKSDAELEGIVSEKIKASTIDRVAARMELKKRGIL